MQKIDGISEKLANVISNEVIKKDVFRHYKFMKENNIDIIGFEDKEYPNLLKEIYSPPLNLYIRGNKNILNDVNIAIIGCRDASRYGRDMAVKFAFELSKENINIVSRTC